MENTLFDTSVWINYSKGILNKETDLLDKYLKIGSQFLVICPTIIQEFLMGLKTEIEFEKYKDHFNHLMCLNEGWKATSLEATILYIDLRKKGITICKSTDCLIAQVEIKNDVLLVHNDSDFDRIAQGSSLRVYK